MQKDNLYRNFIREDASSMLFHLYSRHDQAASIYRQIAADVDEDNLRSWFSSLADFRQSLADELLPMVEDNGSVPVKPSKEMKAYLKTSEDEITRSINEQNTVALIDLSLEAEESVAKYYQEAEANREIPEAIRETLDHQHERLLQVITKAQRLHSVPETGNTSFKV